MEIIVNVVGHGERRVEQGMTLQGLCDEFTFDREILLAKVDNQLKELFAPLMYDCSVEFLDISDANGYRAYQRSVSFLMIYSAKAVLDNTRVVIAHSINKNYYCELPNVEVSDEILQKIEDKMRETVEKDLPIEKFSLPLETGMKIAADLGLFDKVELLKYRRTSSINFYRLDGLYDYFYGQMAPRTGCLSNFKLVKRSKGFILQFPAASHDYELAESAPYSKISEVFEESGQWARVLKIDTVGSLNSKIVSTGIEEVIRVTEALHEKKMANLADMIVHNRKRVVLIAGPTSSGKTTFASRLGVQLRVNGVTPHVISLDNYYVDREFTPRDEDGNYDFETIKALDVQTINANIKALLGGETVDLPTFNFLTGKREYKGNKLALSPNDVLIMEGIHGLNGLIGGDIPVGETFRIFISALTQLNVDDHNRIPTTDTRLVRRIVRDHHFRGYSAARTIAMWPSVMRGEGKYIFPFQEEADAFFNSALVYEMCMLKQFAEPLLFGIERSDPAYTESKRLIKFLDGFLGATSELVPSNSILREFIGGSAFSNGH
ncbi:MAG: hypothetical protein FWG65_06550 [Turicibacter sp.]|nr:hypothetical protein [Turicibacter sp.]